MFRMFWSADGALLKYYIFLFFFQLNHNVRRVGLDLSKNVHYFCFFMASLMMMTLWLIAEKIALNQEYETLRTTTWRCLGKPYKQKAENFADWFTSDRKKNFFIQGKNGRNHFNKKYNVTPLKKYEYSFKKLSRSTAHFLCIDISSDIFCFIIYYILFMYYNSFRLFIAFIKEVNVLFMVEPC